MLIEENCEYWRHNGQSCWMEHAAFITEQNAKLRPANAGGVLQHGLKHAPQLAGRARNDAQHLRGCRLLLQRLVELLFQVRVSYAEALDVSARLRCLRTKAGSASSPLRPLARQDHLVGTVD